MTIKERYFLVQKIYGTPKEMKKEANRSSNPITERYMTICILVYTLPVFFSVFVCKIVYMCVCVIHLQMD